MLSEHREGAAGAVPVDFLTSHVSSMPGTIGCVALLWFRPTRRSESMTGSGPGSWLPDPEGRFEYRWWDGQGWTEHVYHQGQSGTVPLSNAPATPQPTGHHERYE